jgi:hypothetical protein
METERSVNRISAWRCDFCISWIVKVWNVEDEFIEKCDFDIPETRSRDADRKGFQELCHSSKIKAGESRENNRFLWRYWGYADETCSEKEVKWKWSKPGHLGQGIHKCLLWEAHSFNHVVKLEIEKVHGRKSLNGCGKTGLSGLKSMEGWLPQKSAGQSQLHETLVQKHEVL